MPTATQATTHNDDSLERLAADQADRWDATEADLASLRNDDSLAPDETSTSRRRTSTARPHQAREHTSRARAAGTARVW